MHGKKSAGKQNRGLDPGRHWELTQGRSLKGGGKKMRGLENDVGQGCQAGKVQEYWQGQDKN